MRNHLIAMFLYFLISTAVVFTFGFGASLSGFWLLGVVGIALISATTLLLAIGATMQLRQRLGLQQTGRLVQYASFIVSGYLSLQLFSFVFSAALTISSPLLAALVQFALAFGPATLFGEVPTKGRTWLPVRMPKR